MTGLDEPTLLAGFIVFCRIGTCISFAPGFSSPRVPVRFRLLVALGLTAALAPVVLADFSSGSINADVARLVSLILRECAVGATMGIMSRLVFASLELTFTVASMAVGLSSSFAPRVDDGDSMPELAALVLFATTTMLFVADIHWQIVHAIFDSYRAFPLGARIEPQFALGRIVETLSFGLSLAFRLASPFIAFGMIANFSFALLNKIAPQIAIYFVIAPIVLFGGLALLPLLWRDIATRFLAGFSDWLWRL
ncbi:MAG TPA: flagellar biosynthetic protein FliR [Rhodoblastus sp.]|nr:flagellar biosynthetic protein FliR [Rhodoblastus sp.]